MPDIRDAARRLCGGGLALYPTETFYAIGCRADREDAILRVFAAKRRAAAMPLPLILGDTGQLPLVASEEACSGRLADDVSALSALWPSPLTLLLPARDDLPAPLTAGTGMVAVRVSEHPVARALAQTCAFPIVSSSANISGRPPVVSAGELDAELLAALRPDEDALLDLPPAPGGGKASTIAELRGGGRLAVRREGALPLSRLLEAGFTLI